MNTQQDAVVLAEALDPLPLQSIAILASAYAQYDHKERDMFVCNCLHRTFGLDVDTADIQFVYAKLEKHMPQMLCAPSPSQCGEALLLPPALDKCLRCDLPFSNHAKELPVDVYTTSETLAAARCSPVCVEKHCLGCGKFFLGHWSYHRHKAAKDQKPLSALTFEKPLGDELYFLLPNGYASAAIACSQKDLKLVM